MSGNDSEDKFKRGICSVVWIDSRGRKCRAKLDAVDPDDACYLLDQSRGEGVRQIIEVRVIKVIGK